MVTGDQHAIAVETCRRLGMGDEIMEGKDLMGDNISLATLAAKVCTCVICVCVKEGCVPGVVRQG